MDPQCTRQEVWQKAITAFPLVFFEVKTSQTLKYRENFLNDLARPDFVDEETEVQSKELLI